MGENFQVLDDRLQGLKDRNVSRGEDPEEEKRRNEASRQSALTTALPLLLWWLGKALLNHFLKGKVLLQKGWQPLKESSTDPDVL